jgi:AcrR family transcriptional regulator
LERCLGAFLEAGTLDESFDQLSKKVGVSKRMLIHYFGGRENLEERAMALLEERLRARFAVGSFPSGTATHSVVTALWDQTTAPESRGVLLLIMDLSRRGWSGSDRAKAFVREQQRLWVELLLKFLPDAETVEEFLQLFQGAVLAFLVTGDREKGRRTLERMILRNTKPLKMKRPEK